MTTDELYKKMKEGEFDPNDQSSFFHILAKGLLYSMNKEITLRGQSVPHYILNTGDETMALEVKGQDQSKEPLEVNNENHIYTQLPRCAVTMKGINLESSQLTSPYSQGKFQIDDGENIHSFTSEFRRMPLKVSYELTYMTDSFADRLAITQQIITKMVFIRTFSIVYLGQLIRCSYSIPESLDGEDMIDFDEATTDDRRHKINLSIDVETNMPVFDAKTAIPSDKYLRAFGHNLTTEDQLKVSRKYPSTKVYQNRDGIATNGPWEDPSSYETSRL